MTDRFVKIEGCACSEEGVLEQKLATVALNAAGMFASACAQLDLCRRAVDAAVDYSVVAMITQATIRGTIIEPLSQEAEWEMLRVLDGMEERLKHKVRTEYAFARTLPPERLAAMREAMTDMYAEDK